MTISAARHVKVAAAWLSANGVTASVAAAGVLRLEVTAIEGGRIGTATGSIEVRPSSSFNETSHHTAQRTAAGRRPAAADSAQTPSATTAPAIEAPASASKMTSKEVAVIAAPFVAPIEGASTPPRAPRLPHR